MSKRRERKRDESASGFMGSRCHSPVESLRNTSSAPSAAKPTSAACTSMAPPRGTAMFPGSIFNARTGTAASAVPKGTNSSLAPSRTRSGPATNISAATAATPPNSCPARTMRGRSSAARCCNGAMAALARVIKRADSATDGRSCAGTCASCTAVINVWLSCGARSSTYNAKRSSVARRMSGSTSPRMNAAVMSV